MLPGAADTIVAPATVSGRSAIAVLRVSGPDALDVVAKCFADGETVGTPRRSSLRRLRHPVSHEALDTALVTWFPAPHSYTGDDVIEISTHGGLAVPLAVLSALIAAGAREALPGEFTRRALLAGKLDLLQAEAIADLIDARSQALHKVALQQLDGGLSRRLQQLRSECLQLEALLAYDIDFPEEDDGPIDPTRIAQAVDTVIEALDDLLATAPAVPLVREGAIVVLAGAPNAGKSSLFNALIGEARAIVSEIPGTTRDALDVLLDTPGVPVRLVDTAGLRESDDALERMGIEVSARWLGRAHVVVLCGEDEGAVEVVEAAVMAERGTEVPVVRVLTKRDGARQPEPRLMLREVAESVEVAEGVGGGTGTLIETSAETGVGLGEVMGEIRRLIGKRYGNVEAEVPRLSRERHHVAVRSARDELASFGQAWDVGHGVPAIVAAVHVRAAVGALDELIGAVSLDDVLDRLFAEFCVGK